MLNLERKNEIEVVAENIINEYNLGVPGFDLTKFLISKYDFIEIGKFLMQSPTFPPLHTERAIFTALRVPSL